MTKIKDLQTKANIAPKFVLHTNEFGFDMYVAKDDNEGMTDNINDALQYAQEFDNPDIKIAYWKFQTGYNLKVVNL